MFMFCSKCAFYKERKNALKNDMCIAPSNVKIRRNYKEEWTDHIKHPSQINKNNDCSLYREKGN